MKWIFLWTGLAMFSMFFGAGNITFPLVVGSAVGTNGIVHALLGLTITAVAIPFSGLFSMVLFEGNYNNFFSRVGKVPGIIIISILMAIIGQFGAIPRCITLTYSTMKVVFHSISPLPFSLVGAVVIWLCSRNESKIIDVVGRILSPLLIVALITIVVKGIFFSTAVTELVTPSVTSNPFAYGLLEGYNTMDLLASFFFSSVIYDKLKSFYIDKPVPPSIILKAGAVGSVLLSIVYVGFGLVASKHNGILSGLRADQFLGAISHSILGHYAGIVAILVVSLACLTTAIALTVVCAKFFKEYVFRSKITYEQSVVLILASSVIVSTLGFDTIVRLLFPVLQIIYPSLLVLCFINILYKMFDYKPVKFPVFSSMFIGITWRVLQMIH